MSRGGAAPGGGAASAGAGRMLLAPPTLSAAPRTPQDVPPVSDVTLTLCSTVGRTSTCTTAFNSFTLLAAFINNPSTIWSQTARSASLPNRTFFLYKEKKNMTRCVASLFSRRRCLMLIKSQSRLLCWRQLMCSMLSSARS